MLRIVGDICFADEYFDVGFGIGSGLEKGINPIKRININNNDIWLGNLECVVSDISKHNGIAAKQFRIPTEAFKSASHMSVYSVANNHIMQHGDQAYEETLKNVLKVDSLYVGSEKQKSIIVENHGKKYGIVCFSQRGEVFSDSPLYWSQPEYREIQEELNKIQDADCKIVYMHWGNEFMDYPYVEQKKFAHWLIDIGCDLVVGVHSHVLQGYEEYKGKYIFYSLGNFVFNMPTEETRYSIILNIDFIDKRMTVSYEYVYINSENQPLIIDSKNCPSKFLLENLNEKLAKKEDNEIYYGIMRRNIKDYQRKNYLWILKTLYRYRLADLIELVSDFLKRRLS